MRAWFLMAGAVLGGLAMAQEAPQQPVVPALQPASQRQTLVAPVEHYILRPGDTVDVLFRFTPEFNDEVVIGPDGRAVLKSTGDIRLAGYTLPEVQRSILIASKDRLVDPEVVVSLKDFERPHVVVGGERSSCGSRRRRYRRFCWRGGRRKTARWGGWWCSAR